MRTAWPGGSHAPPRALTSRTRSALGALALVILATLTATAEAPGAKLSFGVVPQDGALPSSSDLDLMPQAGITTMRTMLPWGSIESTPGKYDWTDADTVIRETTKRGIQPLVFLYGTPAWATQRDGRTCAVGSCSVYPPRTAETRVAFRDFAAAAAARYGPGGDFWKAPVSPAIEPAPEGDPGVGGGEPGDCPIPVLCPPPPPPPPPPVPDPPLPTEPPCGCTEPSPIVVWQIWNEMNSSKYFAPKVDVKSYAEMLRSAATGIRSVDPSAEIMLGGMWGPRSAREVVTTNKSYLQRLYALGADDSFDSIAIHPYGNNASASLAQLRSARRIADRAGHRDAGIWVTEVGWAGGGPRSNPYVKGLSGQARILTKAFASYQRNRRDLNLRGVFWYSWRDLKGGDAICDWCGHAGLRTKTGAAKPAWRSFVRAARR